MNPHALRNLKPQSELKKRLTSEPESRTTISFYKYVQIENPREIRDELFRKFSELGILGRIYIAHEGINGQISVATRNIEKFRTYLYSLGFLEGTRLNAALDDNGKSFWVLKIKVRRKIVADGINDPTFDVSKNGRYISAEEFNQLAQDSNTVIVDFRNYYEYEVGHFENAIEIPSDTFREQLPMAERMLAGSEEKNVVMYCTGGIRCEKASAFLRHRGFKNVFHLEGGIIEYVRQVREKNLENKFKGKNFVFDDRLGERISEDILSNCYQCGAPADSHTNCANDACHVLFIQCANCAAKFEGCCGEECREFKNLPIETQRDLRAGIPTFFNNSREFVRSKFAKAAAKRSL